MLVKRVDRRRALLAGAALSAALLACQPAAAQTASGLPPLFPAVDPNGVDLSSGQLTLSATQASVGVPGQGGLLEAYMGKGLRDNLVGTVNTRIKPILPNYENNTVYTVSFGGVSSTFQDLTGSGSQITPYGNANGATLTFDGTIYTYTGQDGTVATFSTALAGGTAPAGALFYAANAQITSLTRPNGEKLTYNYTPWDPSCGQACSRLQSVVSNLGYMIAYTYAASDGSAASLQLTQVKAVNLAKEYCDPLANGCATVNGWTKTDFTGWGSSSVTATDVLSRTTTYTFSGNQITQIKKPSGATVNITWTSGRVSQVSNGVGAWTYDYTTLPDGSLQTKVTDPNGNTRIVVSDPTFGRIVSDQNGAGQTTTYQLDANNGRISTVTFPEGNGAFLTYDGRGNLAGVSVHPKSDPNTFHTVSLSYDAACANPKTCNQPNSITRDGAETDFTYDPNSGGVATISEPAGANGVRPVIANTYGTHTASYYTAPGVISQAADPVYKLDQTSRCMTLSSCVGTADEMRTAFSYGTSSPTNLQPVSVTQQDGTGALAATSAFTYNIYGDLKTVDGPLAGAADTVRYRYDADRELVGFVGADPDTPDAGRPSNAIQYDRTPDGLLADVKYGTVASQSDADWANFTKLQTIGYVRDSATRVVQAFVNTFPNGVSTRQKVTQYSYDNGNRLTCSAVRMNPNAFGSLPADACTLGTPGSFGPDRVTKYAYDNADRLLSTLEGAGTDAAAITQALAYTPNGRLQSLTDGDANLTTFVYDDWDRLSKVEFPSPTTAGQSSSTDYIGYTYDDTTWNVTSLRLRDGQSVTNGYDARHNLTSKSLPVATTYAYDNLDRPVSASAGGQTIGETYDALGRRTAESQPLGTVYSQYDLADRRTQLSLPDGTHTTYDYDNAGAMSDIKDTSGATLVTFGYDSFNRLQTLSRSNGVTTTSGYDSLSRLTSLTQAFAGVNNPSNVTVTLGYDPADEITSRSLSNSAYHWAGTKASTTYGVNGLNQLTSANAATITYDARGNLTNDGAQAYGYDAANRLTSAGAVTLTWDPLDRLAKTVDGATTTQFLYDGPNIVAEYTAAGGEQKRYVFGPGADQPLVDYESNTTDWPLADERGSIISLADTNGNSLVTNTYDEYGLPGAGNYGRFQYTGQAWLPDTGLYHYKARAYSPELGRFMQTDPIWYAGGMNLYAYVGDDPVNGADPTGLLYDTTAEAGTLYNCTDCSQIVPVEVSPVVVTGNPPPGLSGLFTGWPTGLMGSEPEPHTVSALVVIGHRAKSTSAVSTITHRPSGSGGCPGVRFPALERASETWNKASTALGAASLGYQAVATANVAFGDSPGAAVAEAGAATASFGSLYYGLWAALGHQVATRSPLQTWGKVLGMAIGATTQMPEAGKRVADFLGGLVVDPALSGPEC